MKPTWDDYYWELECGSQALKWVKSQTRVQLETMLKGGGNVTYQGSSVTEMVKDRLVYVQEVWRGNRIKLTDDDYLWAMDHNELSAWKAQAITIKEWRKRLGNSYHLDEPVPKPEAWGTF